MMRSLIFASLLALQIVLSVCGKYEPEILLKYPPSRINLDAPKHPGKLLNCSLETNTKQVHWIYKNKEVQLDGVFNGGDDYCGYRLDAADSSYAGLWTMTTITDEDSYTNTFTIRAQRTVKTVPADYVSANAGNWIQIGLNTNETDVRSCNITTNSRTFNLMTDKVEGVSLWGKCGVRILADKSLAGQWEIYSQVGEYLINYAIFHVNVPWQKEEESHEVVTQTWVIGEKNKGVNWYDQTVLFCQFERPDGTKLPPTFGSCKMDVEVVSKHHEGTWRASYATEGKVELQHVDIVIKTKDPNFLECSYSAGVGDEINLLCRTGQSKLKFCTFIRPDKHVIHLPAAVGNENYAYYGKGFAYKHGESLDFAECGVTIRKPSAVDVGIWTCEMGMEDGTQSVIKGSVIKVSKSRGVENEATIENPTVYVKRGDSFKISCKGSSKLEYCWLSSPNGTAYSVADVESPGKSFKYFGKGFTMGECGATVPTSNNSDSGKWTCHLGYSGGFEVEQTVPVKVTDSYLIPSDDVVRVAKQTKLTCRTFNGEDGSVKYCRWVRPNGHGINAVDASRYQLSQGIDQCGLTILDFQPEDAGKWTCFAALTRFTDREEHATIELKSYVNEQAQISSMLMIVLGSGLLVFTLVGASYAAFFIFRKRSTRLIKPPPYYPTDYAIPEEIRTGGSPIPTKDARF